MIKLFVPYLNPDADQYIAQVLHTGFLNQGKITKIFEKDLKETFGIKNLYCTNSCTSALHIALDLCEVRGREVILPAQSFVATGLAVLMAGGHPVFCDINLDGNINTKEARQLINDRTAAIITVDWGGNPADILELPKHIPIITDAAHSLGSSVFGVPTGNITEFTTFSFQAIKNLSMGDGGAIAFTNPAYAEKIRKKTWFGMDKQSLQRNEEGDRDCDIDEIGYKYHTNDYCSALGLANLQRFEDRRIKRQTNAQYYLNNIHNSEIKLPFKSTVKKQSWWLFTIRSNNRLRFIKHMKNHGIECSVVDRRIDQHSVFGKQTILPIQEKFDREQVSIPVHENLTNQELKYIVDTIKKTW